MNLIFLTIEVKSRELISKLFFILSNINQKFFFIIGDKKAIERATNYFGKGIYFYKSINDNDTKHIQRIKKKEICTYLWMKREVMRYQMMIFSYHF